MSEPEPVDEPEPNPEAQTEPEPEFEAPGPYDVGMWMFSGSTTEDGEPACLFRYDGKSTIFSVDDVLATGRNLIAAAAAAESDVALLRLLQYKLGLDEQRRVLVLKDYRKHRDNLVQDIGDGKSFLQIAGIAGYNSGRPIVHYKRGKLQGEFTPGEARETALHWIEAANRSVYDSHLRKLLKRFDFDEENTDIVMQMMFDVSNGLDEDESTE